MNLIDLASWDNDSATNIRELILLDVFHDCLKRSYSVAEVVHAIPLKPRSALSYHFVDKSSTILFYVQICLIKGYVNLMQYPRLSGGIYGDQSVEFTLITES